MTRAYIKLDPGFPDRKDYYPDGPWRALVTLFCYAAHQPTPGTFKNDKLVKVLLGRHARTGHSSWSAGRTGRKVRSRQSRPGWRRSRSAADR
jgi:hypothetical protein